MMRGRIVRIGDTPAAEVKAKESAAWALEGDRGVTFSATPPDGSKSSPATGGAPTTRARRWSRWRRASPTGLG